MPRRDEVARAGLADEVNRRVELILAAKEIAPGATFADCSTDAEIRARAVAHVHGLSEIQDASEDVLLGMFRALHAMVIRDPVRAALKAPAELRH